MFRHFRPLLAFLGLTSALPIFASEERRLAVFDPVGRSAPRRSKSTQHPHSSTRQRARYSRQIAAGQLQMERV